MQIRRLSYFLLVALLMISSALISVSAAPPAQAEDYDVANGHFFTQTADEGGFSVLDDSEARFWSEFNRLGGLQTVGYPISQRFMQDGFVVQAFQKLVLQWRPDVGQAWPLNLFDELSKNDFDQTLLATRQTPLPLGSDFDDPDASWEETVAKRQALLDGNEAIRARYFSVDDPLTVFGLPTSQLEDMGNHIAIRTQRAVFQQWSEDTIWADKGQVTIANGGDIAKELGWLPKAALEAEAEAETETAPPSQRMRALDFTPFESALAEMDDARMQSLDTLLMPATILDMQAMMESGQLSAAELTRYYLARIQQYDGALNSVMELNPDALDIATQLDAERAAGEVRGALHGIPIMLKDNIATGDQMHNTAGAAALIDHRAPRDAFLAQQLREAGAILLGKTNLSEWAHFMSSSGPSGYSALGGQVVNPYGAELEVYGSSTGSAVAASAHFAAATVGTETAGSITAPAGVNGGSGMRPTLGLVSRDLIIPITTQLDSAGPMGRNVTDLAVLLTVLAAEDANDPLAEMAADLHGTDFTAALGTVSLNDLTIGVPFVDGADSLEEISEVLQPAIEVLEAAGATIVPTPIDYDKAIVLLENLPQIEAGSMAADVAHYLAEAQAGISTLDEVIAFNKEALQQRAPFGQDLLELAVAEQMAPADHEALSVETRELARELIRQSASQQEVDVILSFDNGFSLFYPLAGMPAVTVPMGLDDWGQPHGATFTGDVGTDAHLLAIAYAFEQAAGLRVEPTLGE